MKSPIVLSVVVTLAALPSFADDPQPEPPKATFTPAITADEVLTRIAYLASDDLAGRESGTDGGRRTEDWVAGEFRRFGLAPLSATPDSPFTDVPMPGRAVPESSWIEIAGAEGPPQRLGSELGAIPFSFSKGGDATGGVVFVGFGITAADQKYDDYAGVDVKGKVVLLLRHGPAEKDDKSPWHDVRRRGMEMSFGAKAKRAADAGAAAVLMVNDLNHKEDALPVEAPGAPSSIPVFAVRRATADLLLAQTGKTLAQLQAEIDGDRKPRSVAVDGLSVSVHATVTGAVGRNAVFVMRGSDEKLRDEAVLVCAHMDHVGKGFFGSVSNSVGQIPNGADDNASGTAALLELAEAMSAGAPCKRTVIFAAWCGEEKGLIGSEYFCEHPLWDLTKIACSINMDMLGRYRDAAAGDAGLFAEGMPTAVGTDEPVARLAEAYKLKMTRSWEAWEQSDHFSFYRKGVPSLFLHTGIHADYHRPSDKWWKIVAEPEARIARMFVDLTREIADAPTRPTFAKKPPRPVLGVRMVDGESGVGAKLAEIVPGLAANVAGLQIGDVITSFDGKKVANAGDLGTLIQATKEGDVIDVVYRRGAEEKTVKVKMSGM